MIKKTLSFFIAAAIILVGLNTSTVSAKSEDYDSKYIRVGVQRNVPSKNLIRLSGNGFSIGVENGNISELLRTNSQNMVAKIKNFSYHIELSEGFSSYSKAVEKSKKLRSSGVNSYVVYKQGFKVWIGEFTSENAAKDSLKNISSLKYESVLVAKNEHLTSIENSNGEKILSFDRNQKIYMKSLSDITKVETKRYRGYIGFVNNKSTLAVVNYVKIGDYLKGVVPREMQASWNIEALKAQAVSARNYTLRNLNKHNNLGYDLCDSTNCQVYDGYDIEHPNSNNAVDQTKNKVLKYKGQIIETLYYACSGGYTSNNEDTWVGKPIPYLRAKEDPYSVNTPHSNWIYTLDRDEASRLLKANGYDVGQIISLETIKNAPNPRVVELKIKGTNGTKIVPKEKVRAVFGYGNVKSTNYIIETQDVPPEDSTVDNDVYVISGNNSNPKKASINQLNILTPQGVKKLDSNQKIFISNGVEMVSKDTKQSGRSDFMQTMSLENNVTFIGHGWGHGVGMSQYGALNMAKAGHDYIEILEFYFSGTKVE